MAGSARDPLTHQAGGSRTIGISRFGLTINCGMTRDPNVPFTTMRLAQQRATPNLPQDPDGLDELNLFHKIPICAQLLLIVLGLVAMPARTVAQTDETQVYDAEIAKQGIVNLMIHTNFTPIGRAGRFAYNLNKKWRLRLRSTTASVRCAVLFLTMSNFMRLGQSWTAMAGS